MFPSWFIERGVRGEERAGRPAVIYLHPRDFATECPRVPMPVSRRFMCYVGRHTTGGKLVRLLRRFRFGTCYEVLRESMLGLAMPAGGLAGTDGRDG